ncbi:restriction endonuclease [Cytobacillus oceanisediminis]|uniref:restriction endonuclease n=1 Tax=Cytobacillus oceanisediminis TaxID=665099 RepID=UPI002079CA1B|nr:restriction endonuclease [Cytobacillus oceanisediminis]USK46360.1 restriction endonuclease [Cytobacillus oceanisediminis]
MEINWKEVNPTDFEKFIYYILPKLGFRNREWFGRGGGDRGRDVVATTYEELPFNIGYERKWVFQCKKWATFPQNHIILNEISTAMQHSPDFWVLVIPVNLTASQIDYIQFLNKSYDFKVQVIPLVEIEEIVRTFPETKELLITGTLS